MGTVEAHLSLAKAYKKQAYEERFRLIGHENLELSTQILMKESIKKAFLLTFWIRQKTSFLYLNKDD